MNCNDWHFPFCYPFTLLLAIHPSVWAYEGSGQLSVLPSRTKLHITCNCRSLALSNFESHFRRVRLIAEHKERRTYVTPFCLQLSHSKFSSPQLLASQSKQVFFPANHTELNINFLQHAAFVKAGAIVPKTCQQVIFYMEACSAQTFATGKGGHHLS